MCDEVVSPIVNMKHGNKIQDRPYSRRNYLRVSGAIAGGSVLGAAGCVGDDPDGDSDDEAVAGEGDPDQSHDWLIGTSYPVGHILNEGFIDWADDIRDETDGRIDITIEEQLDGEFEMLEQVSIGAIEGVSMGSGWIVEYGEGALWVKGMFFFEDWETNLAAYDDPIFDETVENFRDRGNTHLLGGPIYRGAREMTANQAVSEPEDFEGLDMRLPEVDDWVRLWSSLGVNPTTVAFDELYSALQTGVVSAQENPVQDISAMGLPEVQDYLIRTSHVFSAAWLGINEERWEDLHPDDQALLNESVETKSRELDEQIMEQEEGLVDELEDEGMEVIEPNLDAIQAVVLEEVEAMFDDGTWRGDKDEILG